MPTKFNSPMGAETIFVEIKYKDVELPHRVASFRYIYNEEGLDSCTLVFRGLDKSAPDLPEFQEEAQLRVTWGYLGEQTKSRLVYNSDFKWEFSKDGVNLTLEATEKAGTIKQTKRNTVHKDKILPEVVEDIAQKHTLKPMIDLGSKEGKLTISEALSKYNLKQDGLKKAHWDEMSPKFRVRKQVAQANKTDAQLIEEWGMEEPLAKWFTETRDDEIVLKRRNFNQKPYKAYTYEGGTGELFSFTPEQKHKAKLGSALNSMASFWDKQTKAFLQQQANATNTQLRTFMIEYLKTTGFVPKDIKMFGSVDRAIEVTVDNILSKSVYGKYNPIVKDADPIVGKQYITKNTFGKRDIIGNSIDNLATQQRGEKLITVYEIEDAVKKAQEVVTDVTHDPTAEDKDQARAFANNTRDQASLQMNPATALVWGDVGLETGQIITINAGNKKLSGNYYSIKCIHDISDMSAYTCSIELTRQGHNTKASTNSKALKTMDKKLNQQLGADSRTQRRVILEKSNDYSKRGKR